MRLQDKEPLTNATILKKELRSQKLQNTELFGCEDEADVAPDPERAGGLSPRFLTPVTPVRGAALIRNTV
jgi:hypothetical protein